jgi:dimethylargininase
MSKRVFDFGNAIVRKPAPSVVEGLRTGGEAPSYEGVVVEHEAYVAALEAAGVAVEVLEPLDAYPDSVFVEDPAFVLPEGAILLRPGAPSRIGEAAGIAPVLRRRFARLLEQDEGHADGGDMLILPDEILIGLSGRTDRLGAMRVCALLRELGRAARVVETPPGVLHLKTACALADERTLVATPALAPAFPGLDLIVTPEGEERAANLIRVNDRVLIADGYPKTAALVEGRGLKVVPLAAGEIAKIDAGLSCMSLRW